ncbi:MAG: hypothetical protein Fur0021_38000 [Candidatus Promineifilaceae bacterium]
MSEIYAALAYYYDHKEAIDESIARGEEFAEALRQQTPSLLTQKLYERAGWVLSGRAYSSAKCAKSPELRAIWGAPAPQIAP